MAKQLQEALAPALASERTLARSALLAAMMSLALLPRDCLAVCNFTLGGFGVVNFSTPASVAVPRDTPNGTVIGHYEFNGPAAFSMVCTGDLYGLVNFAGPTPAVGRVLMPIGTTGLSWQWSIFGRGEFEQSFGSNFLAGVVSSSGGRLQILELVKTGAVTAGTVVPAGELGRRRYGSRDVWSLRLGNPITVTTPSCSTADVAVAMGSYRRSDLSGIGSTTGQVSFAINLDCPAGVNRIRYRVDPLTPVINASQSVVALDSGSGATGIGLQLLNASGSGPLPLSAFQSFGGNAGAGTYSIPLRARYYQTGAMVGGGRANASMAFTLSYE